MKSRVLKAAVGAALAAGLALTSVPAASAATIKPTSVSIGKIANKTVKTSSSKARIAPVVKAGSAVKISRKTITVKQGKKTRASGKTSYAAKPGTYRVTTNVKYKTKSTTKKLVASGKQKVRMNCTVVKTEPRYEQGLDVELMFLECKGPAFDGVYKARAAYVYYNDLSYMLDVDNTVIWGDSFPEEPQFYPRRGLKFSTTAVPQDGKLYKTTTTWSKTKTTAKTQTVVVRKR